MGAVEKHLIAGLDDRRRGFSRIADIDTRDGLYTASLRYEQTFVASSAYETPVRALAGLVASLQQRGYTELRTRLSFRGESYLGSQEAWLEHPDVPAEPRHRPGLLQRLRALWRRYGS